MASSAAVGGGVSVGIGVPVGLASGVSVGAGVGVTVGTSVGMGVLVGAGVVVGAGVFGGVASLTAAPGISPDQSPPQPAANKIDAIPNMSRASFNIFTLHTRGSMMCRMVSSQ